MTRDFDIEEKTLQIGEEIFEAIKGDVPAFFNVRKWKGRVMDWAMKDEQFKIELFRFIDALPALKHDREIPALLSEYFFAQPGILPHWLKRWVPEDRVLGSGAGLFVKKNVKALAKQFIAGRDPKDALHRIEGLRREGRTFTIDLLGEAVLSQSEADIYSGRYIDLIDTLSERAGTWTGAPFDSNQDGPIPKADVSLKVSSFYPRLDPMAWDSSVEAVISALSPVIECAIKGNVSLTFDMEHYRFKAITLEIFKRVLERFPKIDFAGIAIQTYLKDTEKDLVSLISWARERDRKIAVRLVKGAYWDYEKVINRQAGWPVPVFLSKAATDANFEKMTSLLIENSDLIRPAIASHNIRSIAHAMATAEERGLPKEALEFQALYGMAEPIKKAVAERGFRVREYLPVGEFLPGMAYFVRRLLENTSNESFLRQSFAEKLDFKTLMARPEPQAPEEALKEESKEKGFANTPLTDFSIEENRRLFSEAMTSVKERIATSEKIPLIIGGKAILTDRQIVSINPSKPDEGIGRASSASVDDVEKAVIAAEKSFASWSQTPAEERAEYLFKAATWMEGKRHELAALQILEVGKNWREAEADVAEAIDFLKYYGETVIDICRPEKLGAYPGELNLNLHIARGVAAIIAPWNFPLAIACGMTTAAIAAGNCAILKPSSLSPVTTYAIIEAFEAAGLPAGVLQYLPGPGSEVGSALVRHRGIDIIAFTGSMEVGLGIAKTAASTAEGQQNVKKVIAEMGGKNAIIVDSSADMDEAVKGVVASFTGFQGQKCSACSRVIVVEGVMDDFLRRLTETVKGITIGDPQDPANMMGPMVELAALEKVKDYIETGKREATLHYCAEAVPGTGYYAGPSIFTGVTTDCRIAKEEIFGPLLAVMKAADFDEALEIANSTPYALTGGIYSRSPESIRKGSERFMVGNLYINRKITGALVGRQPFGGFKMSGVGSKAGGREYLLHFMHLKTITENTLRRGFAPEDQP